MTRQPEERELYGHILNVEDVISGSSLDQDCLVADQTIFVGDVSDFDDLGGLLFIGDPDGDFEFLIWDSIDSDADSLHLPVGVGFAYPEDTPVEVRPRRVTRIAHVRLDGMDQTVPVRVPYSYLPILQLGIRREVD